MVTHFIIPVHQPKHFHLNDYNKIFGHIPEKKFSVFLMSDFIKGKAKSKVIEESREDFEQRLTKESKVTKAEVNLIKNQNAFDSLISWSCFADLVSLQVMTGQTLEQFNGVFPEGVLGSMNCSLFISSLPESSFEEIMIVGDFDQSIVTALKSFLLLFGQSQKSKKLTLLTPVPEDEMSIVFEQDLVSFTKKSFSDVGILPLKSTDLEKQLLSFSSHMTQPLLIFGSRNKSLLNNSDILKAIVDKKLSIFYSN